MRAPFEALSEAAGYDDDRVLKAMEELIGQMDEEMTEVGIEFGSRTDDKVEALKEIMAEVVAEDAASEDDEPEEEDDDDDDDDEPFVDDDDDEEITNEDEQAPTASTS